MLNGLRYNYDFDGENKETVDLYCVQQMIFTFFLSSFNVLCILYITRNILITMKL